MIPLLTLARMGTANTGELTNEQRTEGLRMKNCGVGILVLLLTPNGSENEWGR